LQLEQADLLKLVDEVAASYRPTALAFGIDIRVEAPAGIPEVEMDPVRIRQALTNLVVNSIRAMPGGGSLTIKVTVGDEAIFTEVIDTGPGIDPDQLDEVFGRFVKSADSPGSGLGLSIARGLMRAHGGDLEITASGPTGTSASMLLPR
jgi:signal transduction histidine kinase